MPPTAIAGTPPAPYPFSALSPTLVVNLNGTGSTPGPGAASITEWSWALKKPPGSSAALSLATTSAPTLTIDRPGTFIVWLRVKNNLGQWSAAATDFTKAWSDAPDSLILISVETENLSLVIPGLGERTVEGGPDNADAFGKLEALFDAVDSLAGGMDPLRIDDIYEKTNGHGIEIHHAVTGTIATFRGMTVQGTAPAGDLLSVGDEIAQGFVVASYSGGDGGNRVQAFWDLWADAIAVREIRAGTADDGSLNGTLDILSDGVMTLDPGEGYIQAKTDFRVNAITPIANNSGVTITKRGTSDYDVKFAKAEAGEVNSVLDANLKLSRLATLGSNAAAVELKNGVVEISGGVGVGWDLATSYIKPRADNSGLVVQGRGTHTADLFLDEMRSDTVGGALNINDVAHKSGRVDGIDVSRLGPEIRATDETLTNTTAAVQAYTTKITVTGGLQVGEVQEIEAAVFVNTMPDGGAVTVRVRVAGNAVLTGSYTLTADTGFIMRGELHVVSAGVYRLYGSVVVTDDNSVTPMRAVDLGGVGSTYDITVDVQFGATGGANAATLELLSSRIRPAYVAP